ncbi:MAG TPA: cytochrome c3 family protein, partial [Anaeromyxobacter sp.]
MRWAGIAIAVAAGACRGIAPAPEVDLGACAACHRPALAAERARRAVHEPFRRVACASCHLPHGSSGGPTSQVAPQPELCRGCHPSAGTTHPSRAGCTSCHRPHASDEEALLAAPRAALCGRCHRGPPLEAAHGGFPVPPDRCGRCHLAHGPRQKLLPDVVHAVAGECGACHAPPGAAAP